MRVHKIFFYILAITVLIAGAQGIIAQKTTIETRTSPSIFQTDTQITADVDKSGLVTFNGSGYGAFEPVSMNVSMPSDGILPKVVLGQWTVFADVNGSIDSTWQMVNLAGVYTVAAFGERSTRVAEATFIGPNATTAISADLDQCANGPYLTPAQCTGAAWQNGNLNQNQAPYFEGESVSYRMRFGGLVIGATYTVNIEWDATENSGKHGVDYLTSYNYSETDSAPCSGVAGCSPAVFTTSAIPVDPMVAAGPDQILGNADDIAQIPGNFTLFNGTITGVSAYTTTGTFPTGAKTSIVITFTANAVNPVLAWGGHISTRHDWGGNMSAVAIPGSPYHMRLLDLNGSGGNQDRSLSSNAVIFPAHLTIIKDAQPNVSFPFDFTVTGQALTPSTFTLDDDGQPLPYPNSQIFNDIALFGSTNQVIVTESFTGTIFSLSDILCTSDPYGGSGTNNNTISIANRNVAITLEEGEIVTCTFVNLVVGPTASPIWIGGRVTSAEGRPLIRAMVSVLNGTTGEVRYAYTGSFGYYRMEGLSVGEAYVVSVYAKRYNFNPASVLITPDDNVSGLDFTALP